MTMTGLMFIHKNISFQSRGLIIMFYLFLSLSHSLILSFMIKMLFKVFRDTKFTLINFTVCVYFNLSPICCPCLYSPHVIGIRLRVVNKRCTKHTHTQNSKLRKIKNRLTYLLSKYLLILIIGFCCCYPLCLRFISGGVLG